MSRRKRESGWYCPSCGATTTVLPTGFVTCRNCGSMGLRGFERRPTRVRCPEDGCNWKGWDDGGVNDDLGRHRRSDHPEAS